MAVRNRPRGGFPKEELTDAHEERSIWNSILGDLKKLKGLNTKAAEISNKIIEAELGMGDSPSIPQIDDLQDLYREGVRLAEEETKVLKEEPNDVLKNISILIALRTASEADGPRNASFQKSRNPKRKHDSDSVDSPGTLSNQSTAAVRKGGAGRSVSAVAQGKESREVSVKIEETEGGKDTSQLSVGTEVIFSNPKIKNVEGEGIQCIIRSIHGKDDKKRYDVQDLEGENGQPGALYRAHASALIPIPAPGALLPDLPKGKQVLARYPDTTTFYKAEVMGLKKDVYRLKFEGEEDDKEMEVDRRFVLDVNIR
ncbi:MAG: SAGA HAT/Core module component [Cirrosporium novae-zelandiae]|nr:MAG: SAGA HAT/Core module component [Cirrosporium novae-zelandiae]